MKNILISLLALGFIGCGESSNNDTNKDNNGNENPLTTFQSSSLANNTWCQDSVPVTFRFKQGSVSKRCTTQIQVRHNFVKFSESEYFAEVTYVGQNVRCKPNFGQARMFRAARVNEILKRNQYRLSLIDSSRVFVSKVGKKNRNVEANFFVTNTDVTIEPVSNNLPTTYLFNCFSN